MANNNCLWWEGFVREYYFPQPPQPPHPFSLSPQPLQPPHSPLSILAVLNLLQRCFSVLVERYRELQELAGQRVVEVNGYVSVGHADDSAKELVAFAVHQRHFGAGEDVLVVEFPADFKCLAWHGAHEVLVALAERIGRLKGEVELLAWIEPGQPLLEGIDHQPHARDESYGSRKGVCERRLNW